MIQRKGIIVYFEDKSVLNKIDKSIANIYYVSEKEKYAYLYCDLNRYKSLLNDLKNIKGITDVIDSLLGVENNAF